MRSITPQSDWLIVKQVTVGEQVSPGGIALPGANQGVETECEVVECGPGRVTEAGMLVPMQIKKGDRVLFTSVGARFTVEGQLVGCIRESQVVCVLGPASSVVPVKGLKLVQH